MVMSDPKLISPLLDGFAMGSPISDHHGVRCCPAMRDGSDEKYIVKIISIPASQVQLDALLLSGACKDQEAALNYFGELAESTVKEAESLGHLSKLEGFTGYEGWQIVPMEDGVGYEVYLLGTYKRSVDMQLRRSHMTQLGTINLGLDMCAALAGCRRAGFLYLDLKPENIFIGDDNSYRIGDLGLVALDSMQYASMPDRYRSSYTAPEITDAYSSLNETLDIYALGLTLYRIYNGGTLPFEGTAPAEVLPAPMYADYEMAEIIQKACAPDPADRWQDPTQMGQALVNYMQRNGANDVPIVPPPAVLEEEPEAPAVEEVSQEEAPGPENADIGDLSFIDRMVSDETAPTEESTGDLDHAALSQETSDILALADDLIAHETPDPVVAPAKIDVPMPAPILPEPEAPAQEPAAPVQPLSEEIPAEPEETEEEDIDVDDMSIPPVPEKKKHSRKWLAVLVILLLLVAAACGGYYYYQNYYLQDVTTFEVNGVGSQLTVTVKTEAPESALTVTCTDTYGNTIPAEVKNGQAVFTALKPNTQYQVELTVEGNYKLVGKTTDTYVTPAQTNIVSLQASTGAEDGSVILSFTVDGPDSPSGWIITCSAEGEEDRVQTVTAHWATLSGLTVGTEYTITISSADPIELAGETTLQVTASEVITARDLAVTACAGGQLTVSWVTPEGASVEKWSVRCFNEVGYDVTQEVDGTEATFTDIDTAYAYTVEVTAQGMTQCAQTGVSADPISIVSVGAVTTPGDLSQITFQWGYDGADPDGGWLVLCSVDGSTTPEVFKTETNSLSVSPLLPGSTYELTIQAVDGTTLFNNTYTYEAPEAEKFSGYYLTSGDFSFRMCRTPDHSGWEWKEVAQDDYTTTFKVGEKASFVIHIDKIYAISYAQVTTTFVIRDANGTAVQVDSTASAWSDMWFGGYGEMDIPQLPETAGEYTVTVYFNGQYVSSTDFTVTE